MLFGQDENWNASALNVGIFAKNNEKKEKDT